MAQANAAAVGADGAAPPVAVADGAVLPHLDDAGIRAAVHAAAPVAGLPVAPVAGPPVAPVPGALFLQALVYDRFDVDGVLLGPLPTKSNGSCKILPKIAGETWP